MDSFILKTEKLCKSFSAGGNMQHVLKNMDIAIGKGDFTVIMGSSGSGKSTLLYALSGMDRPSMGRVIFEGTDISQYGNDELALFRRKNCGFVFQSIYLLDNMSVLDNVLTSAYLLGGERKAKVRRAKELLLAVGMEEALWNKFPAQLSGGECQRVGIVRALINSPRIAFADEPTGALNSASGREVLDVFTKINEQGQSIIMVTHDIKTALRGNRVLYLRDGSVYGELTLEPYSQEQSESRRKQLQAFLDEMGW